MKQNILLKTQREREIFVDAFERGSKEEHKEFMEIVEKLKFRGGYPDRYFIDYEILKAQLKENET